jgi:hypothetical protein
MPLQRTYGSRRHIFRVRPSPRHSPNLEEVVQPSPGLAFLANPGKAIEKISNLNEAVPKSPDKNCKQLLPPPTLDKFPQNSHIIPAEA